MSPLPHKTFLDRIVRVLNQQKVDVTGLVKPNARVPQLHVRYPNDPNIYIFSLLGEKYVLGRSSQSCDIVIHDETVSYIHLSLISTGRNTREFLLKDESSTNGIYQGKKRVDRVKLRNGDRFTLGLPDSNPTVTITYVYPPPIYLRAIQNGMSIMQYGLCIAGGLLGLSLLVILVEFIRADVDRLPTSLIAYKY